MGIELFENRLIGLLPDHVPLQEMVPLADSLLAAPVLAVAVQVHSDNGRTLLTDLQRRASGLMIIGAWLELGSGSIAADFYIRPFEIPESVGRAWQIQTLADEDESGANGFLVEEDQPLAEELSQRRPQPKVYRCGMWHPKEVPALIEQGAYGVAPWLWRRDGQTMAQTITLARRFNRAVDKFG